MRNKSRIVPIKVSELSLPKDYDLRSIGITQSLLSRWQSCPRAYLLSVNRWVDPDKGKMTGFGSLFHQLLDNTYSYYKRSGKPPNKKLIRNWIEEYVEEEESKHGAGSLSGKREDEIERDKIVAKVLMEEYIDFYPDDFKIRKFDQVEQSFCVSFHKYILRGKIDARYFLHKKNRWLMEHKTKSRIDVQNIFYKLSFDLQNLFYILADELENGTNVEGVLYNIVRNPGDAWKKKFPKISEYGRYLRSKVLKTPSHYFIRWEVPYSEEDKQIFRKNLLSKLRMVDGMLKGDLPFYRNESGCISQFTCGYLRACASNSLVGFIQKEKMMEELELVPPSNIKRKGN